MANNESPRPLVLISAASYSSWSRAVRGICAVVLPIVFVVLVVVRVAHRDGVWASIFPPIGITLTVAMYLLVGVTAIYARLDRLRSSAAGTDRSNEESDT